MYVAHVLAKSLGQRPYAFGSLASSAAAGATTRHALLHPQGATLIVLGGLGSAIAHLKMKTSVQEKILGQRDHWFAHEVRWDASEIFFFKQKTAYEIARSGCTV